MTSLAVDPEMIPMRSRMTVRFGLTLLANFVRAGLSFLSGVLVARALGVSGYGDVHFLLGSFAAVSQLLDMGTSTAFYTFLSRRRRGFAFLALYLGWRAMQFFACTIVIGLVLPGGVVSDLWVGHSRALVLLAFVASFVTSQAWGTVSELGEARRRTAAVQLAATAQGVAHVALIAAAVRWEWLSVPSLLMLLVAEYVVLIVVLTPWLVRANVAPSSDEDRPRAIVREFAEYCRPLVVYYWVGFAYVFADRWLLQYFGGASQQGFFAIGQQFANVTVIVTTSMLKVFWKEVAAAQEAGDRARVARLYRRVSRGLFFVGAWITVLVVEYSTEILAWTVGAAYVGAAWAFALMSLTALYQSVAGIGVTYLYAVGETRAYTRINLAMMAVSIPVTYLLLASPSAAVPGLGLGATGLAVKAAALSILGAVLQMHVIARLSGWSRDYGHQVLVLAALFGLAWVTRHFLVDLVGAAEGSLAMALAGPSLFVLLSGLVAWRVPVAIGFTWREVVTALGASRTA